jgi:hypothetical protein
VRPPPFEEMTRPEYFTDANVRLADRHPGKLQVGICWHGSGGGRSAIGMDDDPRCVPPAALQQLVAIKGAQFTALHFEDEASRLRLLSRAEIVPSLERFGVTDFAGTAALMQQLDLVITIDTAVAHLAGNLGIETWLMLISPQHRMWDYGRWGNPAIYPSIRQFRQKTPGEWTDVIARVTDELAWRVWRLRALLIPSRHHDSAVLAQPLIGGILPRMSLSLPASEPHTEPFLRVPASELRVRF